MIHITQKGDFKKTEKLLKASIGKDYKSILRQYAEEGVRALSAATPKDTGKTANSWSYSIEQTKNSISIVWNNSNINDGVNVAIILQYGHASKDGSYVQGIDYINPALKPVFDKLADAAWKEVIS